LLVVTSKTKVKREESFLSLREKKDWNLVWFIEKKILISSFFFLGQD
jgi:hypothetical protein